MPRGDRTGPYGEGPKTGRQLGYCTGNEHPGFMQGAPGRGRGSGRMHRGGRGWGRGFRGGYGPGPVGFYHGNFVDVSEQTLVENEIRILKDQLAALEKRLSGLKKTGD